MAPPVYALLDGNNFYVSCERVFNPSLRGRPVVVLSNNDGCAISRSDEARALNIEMGAPWFQIRHLEKEAGLRALSANFELYGDLSERMMAIAASLGHGQEIYSIDECFIDMSGVPGDRVARAHKVRSRIHQWIDIPTCVGIGPTKTLAKLANHIAKSADRKPGSYPAALAKVCDLSALPPEQMEALLASTAVGEVWGIGPRISRQLEAVGIRTVADIRRIDPATIRRRWSVTLEKTVRELRGEPCVDLDTVPAAKKEIACTRSFGRTITELPDLMEAVTEFAGRAAEKLRAQDSVAAQVQVFIHTSPHRKDEPQYDKACIVPLVSPSADSLTLAAAAVAGLRWIYRPGFRFIKAGVILMDLRPASVEQMQLDLVTSTPSGGNGTAAPPRRIQAIRAMDALNDRFGRGTVKMAGAGLAGPKRHWEMRQQRRSQRFTTRWTEMLATSG